MYLYILWWIEGEYGIGIRREKGYDDDEKGWEVILHGWPIDSFQGFIHMFTTHGPTWSSFIHAFWSSSFPFFTSRISPYVASGVQLKETVISVRSAAKEQKERREIATVLG